MSNPKWKKESDLFIAFQHWLYNGRIEEKNYYNIITAFLANARFPAAVGLDLSLMWHYHKWTLAWYNVLGLFLLLPCVHACTTTRLAVDDYEKSILCIFYPVYPLE